jgi:protein TonB
MLTVGAGLFGRGSSGEARMLEGVAGEPQDAGRVVTRRGGGSRREPGPAAREIEQTQESGVYFEQAAGAPVAVTEARMRMITREQLRRADAEGSGQFDDDDQSAYFLTLPSVTLSNVSSKNVREVGVGYETGGRVGVIAGHRASIRPGESQTFRSSWGGSNVVIPGTLADVKVRVVWVAFDDGTHWGARPRVPPPPPPAPTAPAPPDAPAVPEPPARGESGARGTTSGGGVSVVRLGSASGGGSGTGRGTGEGEGYGEGTGGARASGGGRSTGLSDGKLYAPEPAYPAVAKAAGAEGPVGVRVTVDEEGNVVAASAVSGHPLLHSAAVDAARVSKFKPTVVDGKPVKVSAVISYVFTLK